MIGSFFTNLDVIKFYDNINDIDVTKPFIEIRTLESSGVHPYPFRSLPLKMHTEYFIIIEKEDGIIENPIHIGFNTIEYKKGITNQQFLSINGIDFVIDQRNYVNSVEKILIDNLL